MANPIVHIEIGCTDKEKTGRFFAELFGWNLSDEGPAYGFAAGSNIELSGHIIELAKEWGIYNTFYVQVDDIEAWPRQGGHTRRQNTGAGARRTWRGSLRLAGGARGQYRRAVHARGLTRCPY